MSEYHFIFTYQVIAKESKFLFISIGSDKALAEEVRKEAAKINKIGWKKIEGIDTAFSGVFTLVKINKMIEAENLVREALGEVLEKYQASDKIEINVALMVDGLGECMEFIVI